MLRTPRLLLGAGVGVALVLPFVVFLAAQAHEHRMVGPIEMTVGWADEPAYAGFKNDVQLLLKDKTGKPIIDLADTLKVEVNFGNQKTAALPLERAFGKSFGIPGDYRATIVPTRPGNYTFHFIGAVDNQQINQSFTSSDTTFDPVQEPTAIEFPVKDPTNADLAGLLQRLGPRVDSARAAAGEARSAAARARTLAVAGIVLGAAGVIMGFARGRK
jgi:hypothetical protein